MLYYSCNQDTLLIVYPNIIYGHIYGELQQYKGGKAKDNSNVCL